MALPTAFTLEIAFTTDPLATPTWTDVSTYLIHATVTRRGRNRELDRMEGSSAAFLLDNADRRFDPSNTSSPYYPNVVPMRRVRFSVTHNAVTYRVFTGFVSRWPQDWSQPNYTETRIECACGFKVCNLVELSASLTQKLSGAQIGDVLDAASWPAADRSLDAGQKTVAAKTIDNNDGVGALARIQDIAAAESGVFFMDGQGRAVFHDLHKRLKTPYTTSQATFGDGAGELPYESLGPSFDDDILENDVRHTREGGTTQVATDAASISKYGTRTSTITSVLTTDSDALALAQFRRSKFKEVSLRFEQMTFAPLEQDTLWTQALAREFGDRLTVKRRPPGGGTITKDCHIEGITHDVDAGNGTSWTTTFQLTPADETAYWSAGDAVNSLAGQTTKAAP